VSNLKPHSLVALVLAGGVAVALVALTIGAAVTEAGVGTGNLSTESSTLLSTSLGAAIGAVATYLGARSAAPAAPEPPLVSPDNLPDAWPPQPPTEPPAATEEYPTREIPPAA
jgi:hypothetical protein